MEHNLLCINQARENGVEINDIQQNTRSHQDLPFFLEDSTIDTVKNLNLKPDLTTITCECLVNFEAFD